MRAGWASEAIENTAGACWELIMTELSVAPIVAVVDDDESVRESLASLAESVGYDVALFGSAEEFLKEVRDLNGFHCLILDVRLPGISGIELHSQLTARGRSIPTILITAHADPLVAMKPGVIAVLYKPFQPEVLLQAVRSAIAESRM
jgi:FixJ family two-component response regulator